MKRIPAKSGGEYDVFGGLRHIYCYLHRSKVKKRIRKAYNKRFRKAAKKVIRDDET